MAIGVNSTVKLSNIPAIQTRNGKFVGALAFLADQIVYGKVTLRGAAGTADEDSLLVKVQYVFDVNRPGVRISFPLVGCVLICSLDEVVEVPESATNVDRQVVTAARTQEAALADFHRLRKYDKVVILNKESLSRFCDNVDQIQEGDMILARVQSTSERAMAGFIEVKLRSIVGTRDHRKQPVGGVDRMKPGDDVPAVTPISWIDENGIPAPVAIKLGPAEIRRATPDDEIVNQKDADLTVYDRLAIRYPMYFIGSAGKFSWETVKGYYDKKLLHATTGMLALLEYRDWLCDVMLSVSAEPVDIIVKRRRAEQVFAALQPQAPGAADAFAALHRAQAGYVEGVKRLSWNWAGSNDPTSDIDVNLSGDGTEWAVAIGNALYGRLTDGRESGIAFDVNLYARDFLPEFPDFRTRGLTAPPAFMVPKFLHTIDERNQEILKNDTFLQNTASLLHMRRYMSGGYRNKDDQTTDWATLLLQLERQFMKTPSSVPWARLADRANSEYRRLALLMWQALRELMARRLPNVQYAGPLSPKPTGPELDALFEALDRTFKSDNDLKLIGPAVKMEAENRTYERLLLDGAPNVATRRLAFDYSKFLNNDNPARRAQLDQAYADLREALYSAVYFANESYGSEGALLQVVGGKQYLSRGVAADKGTKVRCQNISYTVHQLYQSMNEQMGDVFKTLHKKPIGGDTQEELQASIGGFLINVGKYLHRYFNAMKYLYCMRAFGVLRPVITDFPANVDRDDAGLALVDSVPVIDKTTIRFPPELMTRGLLEENRPVKFNEIRVACGTGLEMLKKVKAADKPSAAYLREVQLKLATHPLTPGALLSREEQAYFDAKKWDMVAFTVFRRCVGYLAVPPVTDARTLKDAFLFMHLLVTRDYLTYRPPVAAAQPPRAIEPRSSGIAETV